MKQLSASELNHLSKEDMAAMILQMQQQINTLNEKIAVLNAPFWAFLGEAVCTSGTDELLQ